MTSERLFDAEKLRPERLTSDSHLSVKKRRILCEKYTDEYEVAYGTEMRKFCEKKS